MLLTDLGVLVSLPNIFFYHGRGPCNVMPIQSGNDLFSPSPKVQMAIYLGNRSLGQRECADSSRTIGHRIYVDSQETEASVWSLWLSLAHSGSSDPPGSHFPGPYMYNWNRSHSWQDHSVGSLVSGVRDIWIILLHCGQKRCLE